MMLLELGMMPIRYIIMKKRMMYLNHLLTKGRNKLPAKVLQQMMKKPLKGDWINMCKEDMNELDLSIEMIESMTKPNFKKYLLQSIPKAAFRFLQEKKSKQSKGSEIFYSALKTQSYFKAQSKLSARLMQKIFQLRSRNLPVKANFPRMHDNIKCVIPECNGEDSQKGLFFCEYLEPMNQVIDQYIQYEDIFTECVEKQKLVVNIIDQKYESRVKYLASQST